MTFFIYNQKKNFLAFIAIIVFGFFTSCGIYSPSDARKVSPNADERVRKNLEEGKGMTLNKMLGGKKTNYQFNSSDLIFITLPTPKQEQIAHHLSIINKHFKIICIGGSIGIVSGDEKPVPKLLINLEFFWRLRYETKRRSIRLLSTFFYYIFDYVFTGKLKNIKIRFINKS